jgi:hypothetical protein
MIKSRRLRWAGHVSHMGVRRGAYRILMGNLMEGDHLEDPNVDGRIMLKLIFERLDGGAWTGLIWLRVGTDDGLV